MNPVRNSSSRASLPMRLETCARTRTTGAPASGLASTVRDTSSKISRAREWELAGVMLGAFHSRGMGTSASTRPSSSVSTRTLPPRLRELTAVRRHNEPFRRRLVKDARRRLCLRGQLAAGRSSRLNSVSPHLLFALCTGRLTKSRASGQQGYGPTRDPEALRDGLVVLTSLTISSGCGGTDSKPSATERTATANYPEEVAKAK